MGEVFLAEDLLLANKRLALKMIRSQAANQRAIAQFQREFDIMTRLKHPNLVRVYDFSRDKATGLFFITMDYIPGTSVRRVILERSLSLEQTTAITVSILRTVDFIHSRGIMHRDIKPDNVMLLGKQAIVMDFGLAVAEATEGEKTKGTVRYMAPEIIQGRYDHRVDLYSIGATLYELLSRRPFMHLSTLQEILHVISSKQRYTVFRDERLQGLRHHALQPLLAGLLTFHPAERMSCAAQAITAINKSCRAHYSLETAATTRAYALGTGFIGRKRELTLIQRYLGKQEAPDRMLLLRGCAGVGKTRLLTEVKKQCQLQGLRVISATASENPSGAFSLFIPVLKESLFAADPRLIKRTGKFLRRVLPDHPKLADHPALPHISPRYDRQVLVEHISQYLVDYSLQEHMLVIMLDDLQWTDAASLELGEELLYKMGRMPHHMRILACIREEEIVPLRRWLARLKEKNRLFMVFLKTFTGRESREFITATFGSGRIRSSLQQAVPLIEERVQGNPFFLQSVIKILLETGQIAPSPSGWLLRQPVLAEALPAAPMALIQQTLTRLPRDGDLRALQLLSLLGRATTVADFRLILETDGPADLAAWFDRLENDEILVKEAADKEIRYRFSHFLIREFVIRQIDPRQTGRLHETIAAGLERHFASCLEPYIEELAYHYFHAGRRKKARTYLQQATQKARSNNDNQAALNYVEQYLQTASSLPADKTIAMRIEKGKLLETLGEWQQAGDNYSEAIAQAKEQNMLLLAIRALARLGFVWRKQGRVQEAFPLFQEALKLCRQAQNMQQEINVLSGIGLLYWDQGNYDKARRYFVSTMDMARAIDDIPSLCEAYGNMGNLSYVLDDVQAAENWYIKYLRLAQEINDPDAMYAAMGNMGNVSFEQGAYDKALDYYRQLRAVGKKAGNKHIQCVVAGNIGTMHTRMGAWEQARQCFNRQMDLAEELGDTISISYAHDGLGVICEQAGDREQAFQHYAQAIALARRLGATYYLCTYLHHQARLFFACKQYHRADQANVQALKWARESNRRKTEQKTQLLAIVIAQCKTPGPEAKKQALQGLQALLKDAHSRAFQADILYNMYQITGQAAHGQRAWRLYKDLKESTPDILYAKRMAELPRP